MDSPALDDLVGKTLSVYWAVRAPKSLSLLEPRRKDRLLDVGCGPGLWTSTLASRVGAVVGVDTSATAIPVAERTAARRRHGNSRFLVASAECLPFRDSCFDKILCADVVEHVARDRLAAQEVARVLRPGGRLVITTLLAGRRSYIRKVTFDTHVREYCEDVLVGLFQDAGLDLGGKFYFYRVFSTIARELQAILQRSGILRLPGANLLSGLLLVSLAKLDFLARSAPGGMGIVLEKPSPVMPRGRRSDIPGGRSV